MEYKGSYDANTDYAAGAVVVFSDNVAYHAFKDAPAGIVPHDTHCWERLAQPLNEIVLMFHPILAAAGSVVFDANTLILGAEGSDDRFAITVDASGDTPDLIVEEITNEE